MIRTILVLLTIIVFLILSLVLFAVEWIVGKFSQRAKDISMMRILQGLMRFLLFLSGTKLTVIGKENIPDDHAVLYIGNHRSYFDILVSYICFLQPTGYVAKIQLKKIPILNMWLGYLHGLFLDRDNIREGLKTILAAIDTVKAGYSMVIFPEGTRSKESDMTKLLPFHEGSFKIAQKSGCPIVPMSITNTSAIFEDHFPKIKRTHVIIEFGAPIEIKDLSPEDKKHVGQYVQGIMRETLAKNASLI